MKLEDAPVIVHQFDQSADWLIAAQARSLSLFLHPPEKFRDSQHGELKKLAEDVWGIQGPLEIHTDKTRRGFRVIGLILNNVGFYQLAQGSQLYEIPRGTVFISTAGHHTGHCNGQARTTSQFSHSWRGTFIGTAISIN